MLSLAVLALIVAMMLSLGAFSPTAKDDLARLVAVRLSESAGSAPTRPHAAASVRAASVHAPLPTPPVPAPSPTHASNLNLLNLSRQDFAASDISKLGTQSPGTAGGRGLGSGGGALYGPGEGPGGQRLYNAEWYREPTRAELATYMPTGKMPGEWAMIACRTVEKFHVEDCQELDESPVGSGLARALRRASWQFLVRPPRIEGKPIVGAWVRIRFTFTHGVRDGAADGSDNAPESGQAG